MLIFINEHTQTQFHLLSITEQQAIAEAAAKLLRAGFECQIVHVIREDGESEISIRITKKFDVNASSA